MECKSGEELSPGRTVAVTKALHGGLLAVLRPRILLPPDREIGVTCSTQIIPRHRRLPLPPQRTPHMTNFWGPNVKRRLREYLNQIRIVIRWQAFHRSVNAVKLD